MTVQADDGEGCSRQGDDGIRDECPGMELRSNFFLIFFFKQKTAYEMECRDWSSDVCSSDLKTIRFIFC